MAEVDEVVEFAPAKQGESCRSNSRTRTRSLSTGRTGRRPSQEGQQVVGLRTVSPPLQNVEMVVGQFPVGNKVSGRRPSRPTLHANGLPSEGFGREGGLQGSHISVADANRARQLSSERRVRTSSQDLPFASNADGRREPGLSVSGQSAKQMASTKGQSRRRPSRAGLSGDQQSKLKAEPSLQSLQATLSKLEADKERSQSHAVQCKRALDKFRAVGALMMSPVSGHAKDACSDALGRAVDNAVGSGGLAVLGGAAGTGQKKPEQAPLSPTSPSSPRKAGFHVGPPSPRSSPGAKDAAGMGLTVQRMATAKALEEPGAGQAVPEPEPEEPEPEHPHELHAHDSMEHAQEPGTTDGDAHGPAAAEEEEEQEADVAEEVLLNEDHLKSLRRMLFVLRLWHGSKASQSGEGEALAAADAQAQAPPAEDREMPVQQVFEVVARVRARSGAMLCTQRSFENLLATLQTLDKAGGTKAYQKIPISKVREAFNEQISLQISLSSRYGLSAAEASKGMVYETFRTCMHRLFYRPLETEEEVKRLLLQTKGSA